MRGKESIQVIPGPSGIAFFDNHSAIRVLEYVFYGFFMGSKTLFEEILILDRSFFTGR